MHKLTWKIKRSNTLNKPENERIRLDSAVWNSKPGKKNPSMHFMLWIFAPLKAKWTPTTLWVWFGFSGVSRSFHFGSGLWPHKNLSDHIAPSFIQTHSHLLWAPEKIVIEFRQWWFQLGSSHNEFNIEPKARPSFLRQKRVAGRRQATDGNYAWNERSKYELKRAQWMHNRFPSRPPKTNKSVLLQGWI